MKKSADDDLITQSEAAGLRGVSLASINELVRRGRLTSVEKYGRKLVRRSEVLSFEPQTHKARAAKASKKAKK